jgi:nucleoid DNA-binding protein
MTTTNPKEGLMNDQNNAPPNQPEQAKSSGNGNGQSAIGIETPNQDDFYNLVMAEQPPATPSKSIPVWKAETNAEIARLVDESVDALMEAHQPIFQRGGRLMVALWRQRLDSKKRPVKVPTLELVNEHFLRYTLNKRGVAVYLRNKKVKHPDGSETYELKDIGAPATMLRTMIDVMHWKFPTLIGLINCPTMRNDGSLLLEPGYDAATQFYTFWDDTLKLPPIPEQPTQTDAEAALTRLQTLLTGGKLKGFPFVSKTDEAVALAAMMTPVLRVAFDLAPIFFVLAPKSGTGKSYLFDLIAMIVSGKYCPVVNDNEDKAERDKQLSALLLSGAQLIAYDNLIRDLKSSLLNQLATQRLLNIRPFGKLEIKEVEWRGTALVNGNNITVIADLVRRTLAIRMDAKMERPETRKFDFNPIDEVLKDRGQVIADILTIARAYIVSGAKVKLTEFGGFDEWSRVVREPLVWLGLPDVLLSQEQLHRDDPERNAARQFIALWKELDEKRAGLKLPNTYRMQDLINFANNGNAATAREVSAAKNTPAEMAIAKAANGSFDDMPLRDLLVQQCGGSGGGERGTIDGKKFSYWLRSLKDQPFQLMREEGDPPTAVDDGTYCIRVAKHNDAHGHLWQLKKVG